ncbi:hypothetical protein KDI_28070 [Dictyobacter arantiisoli]|uniref:GtrA/DPMS transmembrane domain-containing protein n=2 Tax=Dictyobacter arantiisoli TaxID=2014874 RepID=A0A5A5TDV0_9CHLR|nr:hypothetical protein KDI_28070 [Dictyobacter arantiisoli]
MEELVEMVDQVAPLQQLPSYRPTRWALANTVLDQVDHITKGRAGSLMKFTSFLIIGGTCAVINLIIMAAYTHLFPVLVSPTFNSTFASLLGGELSLLVNFALNDRYTFHDAPGQNRPWYIRMCRFNLTGLVGLVLTSVIESILNSALHMNSLIAQAIAIIIVLFYNFFFHQFFTYRRVKTADVVA